MSSALTTGAPKKRGRTQEELQQRSKESTKETNESIKILSGHGDVNSRLDKIEDYLGVGKNSSKAIFINDGKIEEIKRKALSREVATIKNAGLKITKPRTSILKVLSTATEPHHLSAEDVYRTLMNNNESIGLATIYRVLTQFEAVGIVERHNFSDGRAIFELKPTYHHDHMVDIDTGKVLEFVNEDIEQLQKTIAEEYGFELVDHELVLYVRSKQN